MHQQGDCTQTQNEPLHRHNRIQAGALKRLARSAGLDPVLLEAVASVNNRQRRLPLEALNTKFQGCLEGLQIGVLGLAFKPGTDDVREAPSLNLIRELVERGTKVRAYDPRQMPLPANCSLQMSLSRRRRRRRPLALTR